MQRNNLKYGNLDYLRKEPKIVRWKVIAGPELHPLQMYDLIFDQIDLKIRKMV